MLCWDAHVFLVGKIIATNGPRPLHLRTLQHTRTPHLRRRRPHPLPLVPSRTGNTLTPTEAKDYAAVRGGKLKPGWEVGGVCELGCECKVVGWEDWKVRVVFYRFFPLPLFPL